MPAGDSPNLITALAFPDHVAVSAIADMRLQQRNITLQVLRLDQIDPLLSGNKIFKLVPNLIQARANGLDTVLSFGGAYSNHLHALAEAGYRFGFNTIAVVRGDDGQPDSHTLRFAASRGMRLIRVSRQQYRRRHDADFISELTQTCGDFYLIPEGGANEAGSRGCMSLAEIVVNSLQASAGSGDLPHEILLPCGTGTTMAGLIAGLTQLQASGNCLPRDWHPYVRGIAVLKQGEFLQQDIARTLRVLQGEVATTSRWRVETTFHWGGYARFPPALAAFVQEFEAAQGILLDPVYTAKMLSAVFQRVEDGCYADGTRLLLLHTGGLQGRMKNMN